MPVNSFDNYYMSWKPVRGELERPYYLSLARRLERDIVSGALPENTKLPPQRELADYLDLNLSTVTRAYKVCELKGLLYAATGRGTFVAPGISAQDTFAGDSAQDLFAPPQNVLYRGGDPVIECGMIRPFYETNQIVLDVAREIMSRPEAVRLLEYGDPVGSDYQRGMAVRWLGHLGIPAECGRVLLAAGAQNALSVVLVSVFGAGDKIAVDSFTYTNFKKLANLLHIQLVAVEGDESGMLPDALESACMQSGVRGVYIMPTCQNPTGVFMPDKRRKELARIAESHDLTVIEDDIYSFLAAGAENGELSPGSSFVSLLPERTIHICSISKAICAGLRVAFVVFPEKYKSRLTAGILNVNLKTVSLNAEIAARLIESGRAAEIAGRKLALAKKRNEIFYSFFDTPYADRMARFFYWLPLPEHVTGVEFELAALEKGVHVLGSQRFAMQSGEMPAFVRVSVTSPDTEEDLQRALRVIKKLLSGGEISFFV